jgi:hypothetical protein
MPYYHADASRESDAHALPDIEIFYDRVQYSRCCQTPTHVGSEASDCPSCEAPASWDPIDDPEMHGWRYWFAFGMPGCLWDSDPSGPYDSENQALGAARELAGYCAHGLGDNAVCDDCPAPVLWALRTYWSRDRDPWGWFVSTIRDGLRELVPDSVGALCWSSREAAEKLADRWERAYQLTDSEARSWGRDS